VFLDRDGTLNVQVVRDGKPYPPQSLEEFRLFPDVPAGCAQLAAAGFVLVVATNQPDVGRGTQSQATVEAMHQKLRQLIPSLARIEACYAPGRADDPPDPRRKPEPGMLLDAARDLNLDLGRSWMVGDRWRDIGAGQAAGCKTILVRNNYDERQADNPDAVVESLWEARGLIV